MNLLSKGFEALKTSIFNKYSKDAGKMLLHMGALGWIFSSAAQIGMLIKNKDIESDQKKFIIPQEIFDAAINIVSFYVFTASVQNLSKKLVSSGFLTTKKINVFAKAHNIELGKLKTNIGKYINNEMKNIETTLKTINTQKININLNETEKLNQKLKQFGKFEEAYEPIEGGVKVIGNIIGSILSCNFITPYVRNILASKSQKNRLNPQAEQNSPKIQPDFPRINMDNYIKKSISINSSPGMKI